MVVCVSCRVVLCSIKNRERFERVVSEFALQCRGLTEVGGTF